MKCMKQKVEVHTPPTQGNNIVFSPGFLSTFLSIFLELCFWG